MVLVTLDFLEYFKNVFAKLRNYEVAKLDEVRKFANLKVLFFYKYRDYRNYSSYKNEIIEIIAAIGSIEIIEVIEAINLISYTVFVKYLILKAPFWGENGCK